MSAVPNSRYERRKALEDLGAERVPERGAVRFEAYGSSVRIEGRKTILRYTVDAGQAVEIALPAELARLHSEDIVAARSRERLLAQRQANLPTITVEPL